MKHKLSLDQLIGQKVFVYYNLHKLCWSVKSLSGEFKGKVVAHLDLIYLKDTTFKVSQKGRDRVLKEKVKNVHAGIVGIVSDKNETDYEIQVSYNPYKHSFFYHKKDSSPILSAKYVRMDTGKVFCSL
jgi:hypothetical protein